jgi:hypothetical protein
VLQQRGRLGALCEAQGGGEEGSGVERSGEWRGWAFVRFL